MNCFKKSILFFFLILFLAFKVSAQAVDDVEMADAFRANGKIYVVVTILSVVFLGIVAFLIRIDRKVSKLEKEVKERNG